MHWYSVFQDLGCVLMTSLTIQNTIQVNDPPSRMRRYWLTKDPEWILQTSLFTAQVNGPHPSIHEFWLASGLKWIVYTSLIIHSVNVFHQTMNEDLLGYIWVLLKSLSQNNIHYRSSPTYTWILIGLGAEMNFIYVTHCSHCNTQRTSASYPSIFIILGSLWVLLISLTIHSRVHVAFWFMNFIVSHYSQWNTS